MLVIYYDIIMMLNLIKVKFLRGEKLGSLEGSPPPPPPPPPDEGSLYSLDWNTGLASYSLVGQVLLNIMSSLTYFNTLVASAAGTYAYVYYKSEQE